MLCHILMIMGELRFSEKEGFYQIAFAALSGRSSKSKTSPVIIASKQKTSKKDDNRCNMSNQLCSARQPSKQDSSSGPIERTACHSFFASSRPTVVHLFEGSGWYSSTWQTKLIKYIIILLQATLINHTRKLVHFQIITSDL